MSRKAKQVPQIRIDEFVANLNAMSMAKHDDMQFRFEDLYVGDIEPVTDRKLPKSVPASVRDDLIERSVQLMQMAREFNTMLQDLEDAVESSYDKRFAARERQVPKCKCCGQAVR